MFLIQALVPRAVVNQCSDVLAAVMSLQVIMSEQYLNAWWCVQDLVHCVVMSCMRPSCR